MSGDVLMGFDVGGSGARCLLLDVETGRRVWACRRARGWRAAGHSPCERLDLEALWRDLCDATAEALAESGAQPARVAGIAVSGMRFATVLLDGRGTPLLALSNRDAVGAEAAARLAGEYGPELLLRTGHWPAPIFGAARLRWLAEALPERFESAAHYLGLADWIAYRLCGEIASDPTLAAGTLLFDLAAEGWAWDWMEQLRLPRRLFPALAVAGERLGRLRDPAADALGLRPGIPVAVGAADTQCGLLGAGAVVAGDAAAIAGTSLPVQAVTDRPRVDPDGRLWTQPHLFPGLFVVESNAGLSGEAVDWMGRLLHREAPVPAARLLAEAERSEPGACGMLSTLGAQVMNAREISLPLGSVTATPLGAPDSDGAHAHLARAVVEGVTFALRANLEQIRALAGTEREPLRVAGGLAQSEAWTQIVCDVLGCSVSVGAAAEASALGAALLAGVAGGAFPDVHGAAGKLVQPRRTHLPEPARVDRYGRLYATWQRLRHTRALADGVAQEHALPALLRADARPPAASPTPRPRILVTAEADASALAALRALGPVEHASFRDRLRLLSGAALVEALAGIQVFVTEVDLVDAGTLLALPELRVIAACRGDAVNVDVDACTALGIPVLHAPGRNAEAVADLTLAFLLALARKLPEAAVFLRDPAIEAGDLGRMGQAFGALRGRELWGKTVGLVGLGAVGRAVARRLPAFGARVLVCDPGVPAAEVVRAGAEPVALEDLLKRSDFVSLHAAVEESSRGLLGASELGRMKRGACLVNTARAALVDEEVLRGGLESGQLGGAALDVFGVEPPGADHPLLALPNVIATPHIGGNTAEVAAHQGRIVSADLARLLRGERPRHVLNPRVLPAFDWTRPRPPPTPELRATLRGRPPPALSDVQRSAPGSAPGSPPARAETGPAERSRRMERLLSRFLGGVGGDAALREGAAGRDATLHFHLTDLGLAFHVRFRCGGVTAALGAPDDRADVELRMPAAVLDGVFTGGLNPMQEAVEGRLSFSGDAAKAMTLQELRPDLVRLYCAARKAVGPPGDLAAYAAAVGAPENTADGASDALRREIVEVVDDLYARQLLTATGGNVSARLPGSDEVWITPSQHFKGHLHAEALVRIGLDARPLDPDAASPSSEGAMHCAVYRARPEARAVVHAHAPHATILADADLPFLPISTEAAFFGDLPRVPFLMPGTRELAEAVGASIRDGWAVLLKNHGLLVASRSLRRAADMTEIIDRSAEIMLGCWAVGREPPRLSDDVVAQLRALGDLIA